MSFKSLVITSLLLGYGSSLAMDSDLLSQCQQVAELTPSYIYENTAKGASEELNTLAQSCYTQNACTFMTSIDKPSCARSLALNSYLIQVAYRTKKAAQPPYTSISAMLDTLNSDNNDNSLTTPNNNEQNAAEATETDTIQWS